jgi:hypothetical protein
MGDRRPGRRLLADAPADAAVTLRDLSPAARQGFLQSLPARIAGLVRILSAAAAAAAAPTATLPAPHLDATEIQSQARSADTEITVATGSLVSATGGPAPQQAPRRRGRPRVLPRPPPPACQPADGSTSAGLSSGAPSGTPADSDSHSTAVAGPPARDGVWG